MKACWFNRKMSRGLAILMFPITVMFYFYWSIFEGIIYRIQLKQDEELKLEVMNANETTNETVEVATEPSPVDEETSLNELKIALKFSKGLIVMYAFTIFPLCILMVIDIDQEWPASAHMYPWLLFRFCSAATPIVYPL